ncbi:MAG: glutamine synthetase beta-grasp domain-containing protein, partial [Acidimicrobiales bacterium]
MQERSPADILKLASDEAVEFIDYRFCDLPGLVQHVSVPVTEMRESVFTEGHGFDGSSIRGFQQIQESDMILIPDPNTAYIDPFRARKTLNIHCFVHDPITGEPYSRDPRYVAKKAETYLGSTGIADKAYFGPEPEFFIFDDVRFSY